jgi:hypothetical protein
MWRGRAAEGASELAAVLRKLEAGDPSVPIPPETRELAGGAASPGDAPDELSDDADQGGAGAGGGAADIPLPPAEPGDDEFDAKIEPIPEPDNDLVVKEFSEIFSIAALVARLKMDK